MRECIDDIEPTAVLRISDMREGVPYWLANQPFNPLVAIRDGDTLKLYCHGMPMSESGFTLANRKGELILGGPQP